MKAHIV